VNGLARRLLELGLAFLELVLAGAEFLFDVSDFAIGKFCI